MREIYDYSDYRVFIKDYYDTHKALNPSFSLRYLSMKAGINSSAFFKFLMEGKRNLTKESTLKVCLALKLKDKEAEYFEDLVLFNQAKSLKEKNFYFERLIEQQKLRNFKKITFDQYVYFDQWYHCAIRELAVMTDFKEDYKVLGQLLSPPISAKEAKASVELLLRLGFLIKREDSYVQGEPIITTGMSIKEHAIVLFQIEMLKKAIESFDRHTPQERMTSSTTISVSKNTYNQCLAKIREMRTSLLQLAQTEISPSSIYQLNINLFPLTDAQSMNTRGQL